MSRTPKRLASERYPAVNDEAGGIAHDRSDGRWWRDFVGIRCCRRARGRLGRRRIPESSSEAFCCAIGVRRCRRGHKYTVTAKDIDYKVGGVLYNSVIELSYEFSIDNPFGSGVIKTGSGKQYYARNIGAIESYFNCSYLGFNTSDTTRLATYMIW